MPPKRKPANSRGDGAAAASNEAGAVRVATAGTGAAGAAAAAGAVPPPPTTTSPRARAPQHNDTAPPSRPGSAFRWAHVAMIAIFNALIIALTLWSHYHLPTPRDIDVASLDAPAHFSEIKALEHIRVLSEDIGYRIVGTEEHVRAEKWLESVVKQYEGWHRTLAHDDPAADNGTRRPGDTQVEVWTQVGDGAHRFEIVSSVVWKKYYSMSNVVVRISDGTDEGKEHAVLLNSHLDSTLPSPGAADDGAGVGIMIELLRILTTPPRPRLRHAVVLLFNNAEESLQDGSHLYSTQEAETRDSVRGVVNLEACGTSGPELLFQATSVPFVEAYSKVPHPFGTVLANDIFSTGLLLSDTDFRQFVEYANLSGLDMAIVGNSYQYHTRLDVVPNFQPGMLQHFGDNILAIVDHLVTSPQSRLRFNRPFPKGAPPIYFSIAGRYFIHIPADKYRTVIMGICALSNYFITTMARADKHFGALPCALAALFWTVASLFAALVSSNIVAVIMNYVLHKPLSWFTHEHLPVLLFGPPAITAIMVTQMLFSRFTRPERRAYLERATFDGLSLFFVITLLALSGFGIGSSYLFALGSVAMTVTVAINDLYLVGFERIDDKQVAGHDRVHPAAYFVISILPASVGAEGLVSFLDLFVPLTGRTGEISPADHIVGTIVGALSFLCLPLLLPLSHRMGTERLGRAILVGTGLTAGAIAVFASPAFKPFDAAHPKRVFVHAVQNITSETMWLNLGGADPDVRGLEDVVRDVHAQMGTAQEPFYKVDMDDYNPDFAILYPVSTFLTPYKMRLAMPPGASQWTLPAAPSGESTAAAVAFKDFVPEATEDEIDWEAGTRRVTIRLKRPDLIWSVMAFEADVLEWDLPSPPPQGMQRHHLKEVARHGLDEWSVRLLLRLPEDVVRAHRSGSALSKILPGGSKTRRPPAAAGVNPIRLDGSSTVPARDPTKLWIDYSGLIGEGMWPQAARLDATRRALYPSINVLETLDGILHATHPEVDSMLLSVIAAVAQV